MTKSCIGKIISSATVDEDGCYLGFTDGSRLSIADEGQSCCEQRYVTCDDSPEDLVGQPYAGYEVKESTNDHEDDYDVHDAVFVEVKAGLSSIVMETHNVHNGYYGGFDITEKATVAK
jgi:hypothetical protein